MKMTNDECRMSNDRAAGRAKEPNLKSRAQSARPRFTSPFRLLRDTDGQVLLLGLIVIIALLAFMLAIPNGTHVTTHKMRAQTSADAGALTGSVWLARGLNLSANMNVGIKSMYTWMVALTTAQALAKALYSDTADASVQALGQDISLALFGNSNPVYVSASVYPQSIQKLAESAQWLYDLQADIAAGFPVIAQTLGSSEVRRNASGGNSSSQNPGGMVLIRAQDSLSLVATPGGDSLLYADLMQLGNALRVIPTNDPNIGPAKGVVVIDRQSLEIKAYYGDSSEWCDVRQVLGRVYRDYIRQTFRNTVTGAIDSGFRFFDKPGGGKWTAYLQGDSWVTPFASPPWTFIDASPGNNKYKRDTVIVQRHVVRRSSADIGRWNYHPWGIGDSILPGARPYVDNGDFVDSSVAYQTDFFTGAESTRGNQGTRLSPRRLDPAIGLSSAAYTWHLEAGQLPFGLSPPIGKSLFPRSRTAASCPSLAVARAEPYLAVGSATDDDYFFAPGWDVRLTPLDSAGAADIAADTAYTSHSLGFFNLEDLRRDVLLP